MKRRDPHTLLADVVERIEAKTGRRATRSGDSFMCCCPAHEDKSPSLSVSAGENAILFKCHTGCSPDAVCDAIGASLSEMFYEPSQRTKGATMRSRRRLTVSALAKSKGLPEDELDAWGVRPHDGGGLLIPYTMPDGSPAPRSRLRNAVQAKKGSRWTPGQGGIGAYGLQHLDAAKAAGCLIVVEGESDTWTLHMAGFPVVGLPGATQAKCLTPEILTDIAALYIVQEPDTGGAEFARGIAIRLQEIGFTATARVVTCGDADDPNDLWQKIAKTGGTDGMTPLDTFRQTFQALLDAAQPLPAPELVVTPIECTGANAAEEFLRTTTPPSMWQSAAPAQPWRIARHRSALFVHDGICYAKLAPEELEAALTQFIRRRDWITAKGRSEPGSPNPPLISSAVMNALAHFTLRTTWDTPVWMDGRSADDIVVMRNGLLDLPTYMAALRAHNPIPDAAHPDPDDELRAAQLAALTPHTPDLFTTSVLPYNFDPAATCPNFLAFLEDILPGPEERQILREWCGYCLTPSQTFQRILVMQGDGQNGKSVLIRVMQAMLGTENYAGLPLEALHESFALQSLIGKLANFSTEWGFIDNAGVNVLKAISGGDAVEVNVKNKPAFTAKLPTRFVVATNEPPKIHDRSNAVYRRLLTIPFEVEIAESDRRPFEPFVAELCEEMPGILTWALKGLDTLQHRGGFHESEKTAAMNAGYRSDSDPAGEWIQDNLRVTPGQFMPTRRAHEAYKEDCADGVQKLLDRVKFGHAIRRWWRRTKGEETERTRRTVHHRDTSITREYGYADITFAGPTDE
jgi:P4 family phage/plasmid primase-like protien